MTVNKYTQILNTQLSNYLEYPAERIMSDYSNSSNHHIHSICLRFKNSSLPSSISILTDIENNVIKISNIYTHQLNDKDLENVKTISENILKLEKIL